MALTQVQGAMVGPTGFANLSGITFPATQVPSADANTLDDYEEGTYTPFITIGGSTTGITYSVQVGHYVKVGGVCTISGYLLISSKGGLSGTTNLAGFPFTTKTLGNLYAGPATGVYGNLTGITAYGLGFDIGPSGTTGTFVFGNGTGCTVLNGNNITNTFSLQWSITYSTN
jgi:hypothetical protein